MWNIFIRTWDLALATVAAAAAARWLPYDVILSVTTELIAFFTIQSAVILPAMIFTAGILKGEGLSVTEVKRFQAALRGQMYFWVTLLGLDLIAVTLLIVGKAASWKWKITLGRFENVRAFGNAIQGEPGENFAEQMGFE